MAHESAFEFGDSIYMLHGGSHVRYQKGASKAFAEYPKPINDRTLPGLEVFRTRIVASLNQTDEHIAFFLSDGRFLVYDMAQKIIVTPPQAISDENWSGLSVFAKQITAAQRWNERHSFFFLSAGRVLRYDHKEKKIDEEYPKSFSQTIWSDVNPAWGDVQQIVTWSDTSVFLFFSSGMYAKFHREQHKIADSYPKNIDERRWPGMGKWLSTETRLSLGVYTTIEHDTEVSFQLPQHVVASSHARKIAQKNRRFLTMSPELSASSEYPDRRSSFLIIPIEKNNSDGYLPIIVQDSSGQYLSMMGKDEIKMTEKKEKAEIFFLDTTWGEYVVLYHHPKHPTWKQRERRYNLGGLLPIVFTERGERVVGLSHEELCAGGLLRMFVVE